jgi:hypothetical protein
MSLTKFNESEYSVSLSTPLVLPAISLYHSVAGVVAFQGLKSSPLSP